MIFCFYEANSLKVGWNPLILCVKMENLQPFFDFLSRYKRYNISEWLKLPAFHMQIYVRRGNRYFGTSKRESLELANFQIDSRFRGQGLFTSFLELVERYSKEMGLVLFIECVHNERLRGFLSKRGYTLVDEVDHSYYLNFGAEIFRGSENVTS